MDNPSSAWELCIEIEDLLIDMLADIAELFSQKDSDINCDNYHLEISGLGNNCKNITQTTQNNKKTPLSML